MSFEDLGPLDFKDVGPLHYKMPRENQVDPVLRDTFAVMAKNFYEQTGEPLNVTDSFRSREEQADLYKKKPNLASPPGKSRHEMGMALDLDPMQVPKLEELGLLDTHGFVRPALNKGETWHIELPRFEKAEKVAATVSNFKDLGPISGFEDLGVVEASTLRALPTEEKPPMLDPFAEAEVSGALGLAGAGLGWAASRPREWLLEPTVGRAYDALAPLVGAPTEKGFVPTQVSLESMMRPGEAGQVGGKEVAGEVTMPAITPRETLMLGSEAKLLGLLSRIPAISRAYQAGQRKLPQVLTPKGKAIGPISPLSIVDNPVYGDRVFQKQLKLLEDTPFGVKGDKVGQFPFREEHLNLRKAAERVDFHKPRLDTLETGEALLDRVDDALPGAKRIFWYEGKIAENIGHRRSLLLDDELKAWRTKLDPDSPTRAGAWALQERKGGPARLAKTGKVAPEALTVDEEALVSWSREKFDDWYEMVNKARILAGKQPFPKTDDYITFMTRFEELGKTTNPLFADYQYFLTTHKGGLRFPWEEKVRGAGKIETDLLKIVGNYGKITEKYVATAPTVGKIRQFTDKWVLPDGTKLKPLSETSPSLDAALNRWADQVAGVTPAEAVVGRWAADKFYKLSNNIALFTMSFNPRTWANQVGALVGAAGEAGPVNLLRSIIDLAEPANWKLARSTTRSLTQRRMDVSLDDLGQRFAANALGRAQHIGMYPVEVVDDFVATASYLAGLKRGKQLGLKGEDLTQFADQLVERTQGAPSPLSRSYIQASKLGKGFTTFQTFTIADANWVSRHILGINNPNWSSREMWKKVAGATVAGVTLVGAFRGLGIRAPVPDFLRVWETYDGGGSTSEIAQTLFEETAPYIPVAGGLAYGKAPGGPVASLVLDTLTGVKNPTEALAALTGVPAGGVAAKFLKSQPGIELRSELERSIDLPIGPRGKFKEPPLSAYESIMGVDRPFKPKRTENRLDEMLRRLVK